MNRANHNQKTLALFDIVGTYFIDQFYNRHYINAKNWSIRGTASNKPVSITDGYRSIVVTYMNGMRSSTDHYKQTVMSLHTYYEKYSGMGTMTFGEFQDQFVSQFVPSDYYNDFTNANKDKAMRDILADLVAKFGSIMSSKEVLMSIIDDHMNPQNITALQDRIVEIMLELREGFYSKFVDEIANSNSGGISPITFGKLKAEYILEKRRRIAAETERDKLAGIAKQLIERAQSLEAQLASTRSQVNVISEKLAITEKILNERPLQMTTPPTSLQTSSLQTSSLQTSSLHAPQSDKWNQVESMRKLKAAKMAERAAKDVDSHYIDSRNIDSNNTQSHNISPDPAPEQDEVSTDGEEFWV